MTKLLHIQTSPRIGRSASIAVAEHFLGVYRAEHPGDTVETLNLWEADLPEFDGATIDAKYAIVHGQTHTPTQLEAWRAVVDIVDHFKSADKYLFSLPMWNFGILTSSNTSLMCWCSQGSRFLSRLGQATRA